MLDNQIEYDDLYPCMLLYGGLKLGTPSLCLFLY